MVLFYCLSIMYMLTDLTRTVMRIIYAKKFKYLYREVIGLSKVKSYEFTLFWVGIAKCLEENKNYQPIQNCEPPSETTEPWLLTSYSDTLYLYHMTQANLYAFTIEQFLYLCIGAT